MNEALQQFLDEIKQGNGQRVSTLQKGTTVLYIIQDDSVPTGCMGTTHTQYKNDPPRPAFVFYGVCVKAEDSSKFTEGWQGAAVPFRVPRTVAEEIIKKMLPNEFDDPATLSTLDPDTGALTLGSAFVIDRYKDAKDFWTYDVSVAKRLPKGVKPPAKVEVPEQTIADCAQEQTEWQDKMTAKRDAEKADVPPTSNAKLNF